MYKQARTTFAYSKIHSLIVQGNTFVGTLIIIVHDDIFRRGLDVDNHICRLWFNMESLRIVQ